MMRIVVYWSDNIAKQELRNIKQALHIGKPVTVIPSDYGARERVGVV